MDRVGLCRIRCRVEALDLLGEVGKMDDFRYKKCAWVYEPFADEVDT